MTSPQISSRLVMASSTANTLFAKGRATHLYSHTWRDHMPGLLPSGAL